MLLIALLDGQAIHEEFVVVDYVNDGIDTRIQSKAVDGVPDEVMQGITSQLVELVALRKS